MFKEKTEIKTKKYTEEHRDQLVNLIFDAYSNYPEYGESSHKKAKKYINWLKNHSTMFDIAFIDKELAGFIVVDTNWKNLTGENVGEIHELAIKKKFWGHGLGKLLMNNALSHIKSKGIKKAGLWVGEKNKEAIDFYKRFGFKQSEKYNHWLRMERSL